MKTSKGRMIRNRLNSHVQTDNENIQINENEWRKGGNLCYKQQVSDNCRRQSLLEKSNKGTDKSKLRLVKKETMIECKTVCKQTGFLLFIVKGK